MINFNTLGFGYEKTNVIVMSHYRNGSWSTLQTVASDQLTLHAGSPCLHYGLQVFEGIKAFRAKDNSIRIFRPDENARRMMRSAEYIGMTAPPQELFVTAVTQAVRQNREFVPPYESGASMYIRPLLLNIGAQLDLSPAPEYLFLVMVTPVGAYGKGLGMAKAVIERTLDRAAPHGTGAYKVGGNYAGAMLAGVAAKKAGYGAVLYLDAKEKKYIDEFGTSNFFAVKNNTYLTPESDSILPSITNKSLLQLARDMGLYTEKRPIALTELAGFEEIGACGTALVITPIGQIDDPVAGHSYTFGNTVGPISKALYDTLRGIQYGDITDKYGWCVEME